MWDGAHDPFFDVAARLTTLGLEHGKGSLRGYWEQRNSWNIPGPIYVGDDDACGTGPLEAPNNTILLTSGDTQFAGRADFGGEFLYRQPSSDFELRQIVRAADVNVLNAYGADGNLHWKRHDVALWWRSVRDLRTTLKGSVDRWLQNAARPSVGPTTDQPSPDLRRWLHYIEDGAEIYLREYCYFLDYGCGPAPEAILPDL